MTEQFRQKKEPGLKDTWRSARRGGNIIDRRGEISREYAGRDRRAAYYTEDYFKRHPYGPPRKVTAPPGRKRYAPNGRVK